MNRQGALTVLLPACFFGSLWGQEIDTARALGALRDARAACEADAGRLWGRSLCGPIALADRSTRLAVTNDTVAGRPYVRLGDAFLTTLPASQFVANTSFAWGDRAWTLVALPLPRDRYARVALVMHEVFHREQDALGLREVDALNNHLDQRAGRTWLRLEYRALAAALDTVATDRAAARRHLDAALLFRAYRRSLYPGSDSLEISLEMQEGLPEYTGQEMAMRLTGERPARIAAVVREYEGSPTFVRAFAYGTGPALGVLLDAFAPDWRTAVRSRRDPGGVLADAIGWRAPANLAAAARSRAAAYGWAEVDRAESAREAARAPLMAAYRARLADGPTITLHQTKDSLRWGFDPTTLVGFDLRTTVYPWGTFSAPWGRLDVDSNGVLVRNDFSVITVGTPPGGVTPDAKHLEGPGWTLTLNPGWSLSPDAGKAGSYVVTPTP